MALQNFQYDTIMREYSRRQARSRRELEERRQEAFRMVPRLAEIDGEVASLSAQKARALIQNGEGSVEELKKQVSLLAKERLSLLRSNGFPEDFLEARFVCPLCQDTGYIGNRKCSCFKKAEIEFLYSQSNLKEILEKENFEHFSFDWYSDTIQNETTGMTALETARRAYESAWSFVRNFDSRFQNLFLYGSTGVGKTFLSHCIAHELLETAHCVLYFSAYDLFDRIAHTTFSRRSDTEQEEDFIYDCDLLIIDDLGTELTNSFVSAELFFCINERLTRRKATIISTNLSLEDFSATYSERTFSRIASNYQMLKLIGKDIRIQKIFLGGK